MLVGMKCQIGCYYYLQLVSIDAYCGESTGNFIFHILIGCIFSTCLRFPKNIKWIYLSNLNSFIFFAHKMKTKSKQRGLRNIQHLVSVENFPSLVKLWSYENPSLERISNNPSLQWIDISNCQALKELDGLPSLRSLEWWDWVADALPEYLRRQT